jgi:hypothetical protein
MDFDETIQVLKGLVGRVVEVSITLPDDRETIELAGFSGNVNRVERSPRGGPELWRVWFEDRPHEPGGGIVSIHRTGFEGAEVRGSSRSLEEVIEEDDETTGATWEIFVRQYRAQLSFLIYV